MAEHDSVEDMPGGESIDRADVFGEPCEILVSAGLQGQISGENVSQIQARIVAEAANGATSPEADSALFDNGVTVIPDLLCTAGGFVVGYFEWVQDLQSFFWTDAEVTAELERVMNDAVRAVMTAAERHHVDLRTAALMVGVGRAAEATTLRGLYP